MPITVSTGDSRLDHRFQWASASLEQGDAETAVELLAGITGVAGDWAPGWYNLGKALWRLGRQAEASAALRRYLGLEPEDRLGAGLILAELGVIDAGAAIAPGYVQALFDDYAQRFDGHLVDRLGYRGPQVLIETLAAARPSDTDFDRVIDLGCGTGLMGRALQGRARHMVGIDLSGAMLAQAQRTGIYAELLQADLIDGLRQQRDKADLVVAADVLVYVGELGDLFEAVAGRLAPGAPFAFTAQTHDGPGFRLGSDARYSHGSDYVRTMAAASGLHVARLDNVSTRMDAGKPVPGLVAVLELAA